MAANMYGTKMTSQLVWNKHPTQCSAVDSLNAVHLKGYICKLYSILTYVNISKVMHTGLKHIKTCSKTSTQSQICGLFYVFFASVKRVFAPWIKENSQMRHLCFGGNCGESEVLTCNNGKVIQGSPLKTVGKKFFKAKRNRLGTKQLLAQK